MARVGRLFVTAAVLGSGIGHALADLNRTHVFNPRWMPHARFHAASAVATDVGWSIAPDMFVMTAFYATSGL